MERGVRNKEESERRDGGVSYRGEEQNPDSIEISICYLPVMVEFTRKLELNILILYGKQGSNQAFEPQILPYLQRKR